MPYIGQATVTGATGSVALPAGTAAGDLIILGIAGGSAVSSSDSRLTLLLEASNGIYMTRIYTGLADAGLGAVPYTTNGGIQSGAFVVVLRNLVVTDTAQSPAGGGIFAGATNSIPLVDTPCDYAVAIRFNVSGTVAGQPGTDGPEWVNLSTSSQQKTTLRALGWTNPSSTKDIPSAGSGWSTSGTIGSSAAFMIGLDATVVSPAQVSREHVEALVQIVPDVRVSREHVETLVNLNPNLRVHALRAEALISQPPPPQRAHALRVEVLYSETRQTVTVNRAIETDTASQLAFTQYRTPGIATETDSAAPLARRYVAVLQVVETDTATGPLVVLEAQSVLAGAAIETDTARPVAVVRVQYVGVAQESDTAIGPIVIRVGQTVAVAQASETDSAQVVGVYSIFRFNVSVPVELDDAQPLVVFRKHPLLTASTVDTARAVYIEWVTNPSGEVLV